MVKITILYPNKPGSHFDAEYYLNTHMPMAGRLLGSPIKAITAEIGRPGPDGAPAPFAAIATFTTESVDDFVQAFMPVAGDLQGDIPKYTNIEPVIQYSDLRIG